MNIGRIKSYTVIEMLVVMLVSAISIGITYSCYTIVSKQYSSYKKKSEELSRFILLDRLLCKDFSECKKVQRTQEGIDCISTDKVIKYGFYENYILRRGEGIDTFRLGIMEDMAAKYATASENIPGNIIDELEVNVVYEQENIYFYHQKKYGADILMQTVISAD